MTDNSTPQRAIDLSVEVAGTPEEVWQAIATGPGISSWYVPHTVEERTGGAATASFGEGPEMQIAARVAAWEPPKRILFDKGEGEEGLAFEWLVEARDQATCIVRLINSGFGSGEEWDSQFDAMKEGWGLFLRNLQLHCTHFRGQSATAMLPMAMWTGPSDEIWNRLLRALQVSPSIEVGERIQVAPVDGPSFAGTVMDRQPHSVALVVDEPCPGTVFVAVEGQGVSIWSYLYGPDQAEVTSRDLPRWNNWLSEHAQA